MTGKILVIGATGNVGKPLVKALVAKGEAVKAASRSGKNFEGAEGVAFDIGNPATFADALDGVDRLYLLAPTGTADVKGTLVPVVEAAKARGIKVVLQTAIGVDSDDSIPYRQVEIALQNSDTPYVILRPNWFSDNFQTFWKPGIDHGVISVPAGEGKSSFIDARDIAESAAAALTNDSFNGKAFNLTGPKAYGYSDAAAILSGVLGKPIAYKSIDDETFIGILVGAGVPKDYASFLATIFYPVREGWTAGVTADVETLTGKKPRDLETYAKDNVAALKA